MRTHDVWLSVVSHLRPGNVRALEEKAGGPATWYVGQGESRAYFEAGATSVVEAGGLVAARNAALDDAFAHNLPCVQLDDDLRAIHLAKSKREREPMTLSAAIAYMLQAASDSSAYLAGVAPTSNSFYFNPLRPVKNSGFVIASLCCVLPSPIRFDPAFTLKEDYDFTLAHLHWYGNIARCDAILADFLHYTNSGGAVAVRNSETEAANIERLKAKWPAFVRDHPRRDNEVLLKSPPKAAAGK